MEWSSEAEQALKEVPFFVRPAVRKKIESIANAAGIKLFDADGSAEARAQFNTRGYPWPSDGHQHWHDP